MRKALIVFVAVLVASLALALYAAESNTVISIQGVLTNASGQTVTDGNYKFEFGIYKVATGGTALFTEVHDSVFVKDGVYNVLLGGLTAGGIDEAYFRDNSSTWLGIKVETDSEMEPRIKFASTPYAFRAKFADNAAGARNLLHPTIEFGEPVSYRWASSSWKEYEIASDEMLIVTNATYNDYNGKIYNNSAFAEIYIDPNNKCELVVWEITELKGSAIIPPNGKLRLKVRGVSNNEVNVHGYIVPADSSITPVARMVESGSSPATYPVPVGKTLVITHAFIADGVNNSSNYVKVYDNNDALYSTIVMSERKQLETPLMVKGGYKVKYCRRGVSSTYNRGVGFCGYLVDSQ